jgi:hypothetical protein
MFSNRYFEKIQIQKLNGKMSALSGRYKFIPKFFLKFIYPYISQKIYLKNYTTFNLRFISPQLMLFEYKLYKNNTRIFNRGDIHEA